MLKKFVQLARNALPFIAFAAVILITSPTTIKETTLMLFMSVIIAVIFWLFLSLINNLLDR